MLYRLNYGDMPTREQFDTAWDKTFQFAGEMFAFGNDKRVGTCKLTREQVWDELNEAHSEWKNDGSQITNGYAGDAGDWCSCVLGVLGIEWI